MDHRFRGGRLRDEHLVPAHRLAVQCPSRQIPSSIVGLLSKDFVKPVAVAFVVTAPLAWLAMQRWLEDFAYRVDLGAGVFALAGTLALVVAVLAVGYHAVRAATADPVKSLRYE